MHIPVGCTQDPRIHTKYMHMGHSNAQPVKVSVNLDIPARRTEPHIPEKLGSQTDMLNMCTYAQSIANCSRISANALENLKMTGTCGLIW